MGYPHFRKLPNVPKSCLQRNITHRIPHEIPSKKNCGHRQDPNHPRMSPVGFLRYNLYPSRSPKFKGNSNRTFKKICKPAQFVIVEPTTVEPSCCWFLLFQQRNNATTIYIIIPIEPAALPPTPVLFVGLVLPMNTILVITIKLMVIGNRRGAT